MRSLIKYSHLHIYTLDFIFNILCLVYFRCHSDQSTKQSCVSNPSAWAMFLQQVGDIQFFRLFWILSLYSVVFYRLWWICRKFFLAKCHQTFETLIWEETSNQILRCTFWFQFFCLEEIPHYHHKDEQYFTKVLSIKLIKGSCVYLGKSSHS